MTASYRPCIRIAPDDSSVASARVAAGETVLAQDLRQHEVGVGVVGAHGRQHVEGSAAGLVDRAVALTHRGAPARASSAPSPPRRR